MQFFYNDMDSKKWDKARRLLDREDYQRLLQFLYMNRDNRIILRDIQQEFGINAVVQKELDRIVDLGIILRQDRSYSFHVPIIEKEQLAELTKKINYWLRESEQLEILMQLQSKRKELDEASSFHFSNPLFIYLITSSYERKTEKEPFVIANANNEKIHLPKDLSFCYQMGTETFSFESIGEERSWAKYFHNRVRELPIEDPMDERIFEKIGDVEAIFFLDMLGKKIMQIQLKKDFKEHRYNLWTDVLIETEEIKSTENGYAYQLPIYRRSEIKNLQDKAVFFESEHLYEKLIKKVQQTFSEERLAEVILKPLLLENLMGRENQKESVKWLVLEKE